MKQPKIVYAGSPEETFHAELWSEEARRAMKKHHFEVAVPDFPRQVECNDLYCDFLRDADAIITTWFSPCINQAALKAAPNLKIIGHAAGSLAGYIAPEVFDAKIKVVSANTDMAHAVAEWCLLGALMGRRNVTAYSRLAGCGEVDFPNRSNCRSIRNAVVGIWGFGAVAEHLCAMLQPLRPSRILVFSSHLSDADAVRIGIEKTSFDELVSSSDILFPLAGLNSRTEGMLDKAHLAMLPDHALVVNGGRGQLIEEQALHTELRSGRISAVLDVYHTEPLPKDDPLRTFRNVILTPHNAGYPSRGSYIATILDEFDRFFRGEALRHEVMPDKMSHMTDNKIHPVKHKASA